MDADLAGAFDNIDHDHLLRMIGDFPARGMIADWLQAGVIEAGKGFAPTVGARKWVVGAELEVRRGSHRAAMIGA